MSKRKVLTALAIAAAAASFFIIVPLAREFAGEHLGWSQTGQDTFARFAFFPILLVLLYVLRRLGLQSRDQPPGSK